MESESNSSSKKKSQYFRILAMLWIVLIVFATGIGLMVYSDLFSILWLIGSAVSVIFFIWSLPLMSRYIEFKLSNGTPEEVMRFKKRIKIGAIIPPILVAIFIGIALLIKGPGQDYIFLIATEVVTVIYAIFTFLILSKHKKEGK